MLRPVWYQTKPPCSGLLRAGRFCWRPNPVVPTEDVGAGSTKLTPDYEEHTRHQGQDGEDEALVLERQRKEVDEGVQEKPEAEETKAETANRGVCHGCKGGLVVENDVYARQDTDSVASISRTRDRSVGKGENREQRERGRRRRGGLFYTNSAVELRSRGDSPPAPWGAHSCVCVSACICEYVSGKQTPSPNFRTRDLWANLV